MCKVRVFLNENPASHRIPAALNKLFHKTNAQSSLNLFRETFEEPLLISKAISFRKEFKRFCEIVPQFMEKLTDEIKKEDPLFAFQPVLNQGVVVNGLKLCHERS